MEDHKVVSIDIEYHSNNCVDGGSTLLSKTGPDRSVVIKLNEKEK